MMLVVTTVARVFRRGDFPCDWHPNPRPGQIGPDGGIDLHLARGGNLQRRPLKFMEPISLKLYRIRAAGSPKQRFNFFMGRTRNCMGDRRTIDRILRREEIAKPSEAGGIANSYTRSELPGDTLNTCEARFFIGVC
jgi:hypothetical protein